MALVLFRPAFGRWAAFFFLCLMAPGDRLPALFHRGADVRLGAVLCAAVRLCRLPSAGGCEPPRRRWWVTLTLAGLCAGYLHYFALLAVGFVYLALLVCAVMEAPSRC